MQKERNKIFIHRSSHGYHKSEKGANKKKQRKPQIRNRTSKIPAYSNSRVKHLFLPVCNPVGLQEAPKK